MKKTILTIATLSVLGLGARAEVDKKTERTWKSKCASCHGAQGKADTEQAKKLGVANMADPAWQKGKTDAQIKTAIESGVKDKMEGYKDKLGGPEIDSLVSYVRTLK